MKSGILKEKIEYSLAPAFLVAMLTLIYDDFSNIFNLISGLILCVGIGIFFFLVTEKKDDIYLITFSALSLISCKVILLTDDIHILLSLFFFILSLSFAKKIPIASAISAGLCVLSMPFSVLFFVPSILTVLLSKKKNISAIICVAISIGAFILTKFFSETEFYSEQFSSYHLSLHLVHFSVAHLETLKSFLLASLPFVAIVLYFVLSFALKKKLLISVALVICILLGLWGFALSKNLHTVFLIFVSVILLLTALENDEEYCEAFEKFNLFFKKNLLVFLLLIVFTAGYPLIFGNLPFDSDFFSKTTFIIFRQE